MAIVDTNHLIWQDKPGIGEEILNDLEVVYSSPNTANTIFLTKRYRYDYIEKLNILHHDFTVSNAVYHYEYRPDIHLIMSDFQPPYYRFNIRGLAALADADTTNIYYKKKPEGGKYFFTLAYNSKYFEGLPHIERMAKIGWGQQAQVQPAQGFLLEALTHNRLHIDCAWLQNASPLAHLPKDMSAFDAQLEFVLGRAQARHALKEIING